MKKIIQILILSATFFAAFSSTLAANTTEPEAQSAPVAASMPLYTYEVPAFAAYTTEPEVQSAPVAAPMPLYSNEISFGYGRMAVPQIAFVLGGVIVSGITLGAAVLDKAICVGAFNIEYQRHLFKHLAVGGAFVVEGNILSFKTPNGTDENGNTVYKPGELQPIVTFSVMPSIKVPWFKKQHVSMYTSAYAGLLCSATPGQSTTTTAEDGTTTTTSSPVGLSFAYHLSAVGVDVGGQAGNCQVRAFAELGFGMKGIYNFGLRLMF